MKRLIKLIKRFFGIKQKYTKRVKVVKENKKSTAWTVERRKVQSDKLKAYWRHNRQLTQTNGRLSHEKITT